VDIGIVHPGTGALRVGCKQLRIEVESRRSDLHHLLLDQLIEAVDHDPHMLYLTTRTGDVFLKLVYYFFSVIGLHGSVVWMYKFKQFPLISNHLTASTIADNTSRNSRDSLYISSTSTVSTDRISIVSCLRLWS